MTRHVLITEDSTCNRSYDWDELPTVRISWDVPAETILELPMAPDDIALRVSLADLRAWAKQREVDQIPVVR